MRAHRAFMNNNKRKTLSRTSTNSNSDDRHYEGNEKIKKKRRNANSTATKNINHDKSTAIAFTPQEEQEMIDYLIDSNWIPKALRVDVWHRMRCDQILAPHRHPLSLLLHFGGNVLPRYKHYTKSRLARSQFHDLLKHYGDCTIRPVSPSDESTEYFDTSDSSDEDLDSLTSFEVPPTPSIPHNAKNQDPPMRDRLEEASNELKLSAREGSRRLIVRLENLKCLLALTKDPSSRSAKTSPASGASRKRSVNKDVRSNRPRSSITESKLNSTSASSLAIAQANSVPTARNNSMTLSYSRKRNSTDEIAAGIPAKRTRLEKAEDNRRSSEASGLKGPLEKSRSGKDAAVPPMKPDRSRSGGYRKLLHSSPTETVTAEKSRRTSSISEKRLKKRTASAEASEKSDDSLDLLETTLELCEATTEDSRRNSAAKDGLPFPGETPEFPGEIPFPKQPSTYIERSMVNSPEQANTSDLIDLSDSSEEFVYSRKNQGRNHSAGGENDLMVSLTRQRLRVSNHRVQESLGAAEKTKFLDMDSDSDTEEPSIIFPEAVPSTSDRMMGQESNAVGLQMDDRLRDHTAAEKQWLKAVPSYRSPAHAQLRLTKQEDAVLIQSLKHYHLIDSAFRPTAWKKLIAYNIVGFPQNVTPQRLCTYFTKVLSRNYQCYTEDAYVIRRFEQATCNFELQKRQRNLNRRERRRTQRRDRSNGRNTNCN